MRAKTWLRPPAPQAHLYDSRLDDVIEWLMSQDVAIRHGDQEEVVPHKRGAELGQDGSPRAF